MYIYLIISRCSIFCVWPFGFIAIWLWVSQMSGLISMLGDDGKKEGAWGDWRTYSNEFAEWVGLSSASTKVRQSKRDGLVSVRSETGETDSHIERTGQLERGIRIVRVNETERSIHKSPLVPSGVHCKWGGPKGEGLACQSVAGRRVDVNTRGESIIFLDATGWLRIGWKERGFFTRNFKYY